MKVEGGEVGACGGGSGGCIGTGDATCFPKATPTPPLADDDDDDDICGCSNGCCCCCCCINPIVPGVLTNAASLGFDASNPKPAISTFFPNKRP